MIRFVDVRSAEMAGYRFAYWDTVRDRFVEFAGNQAWGTFTDLIEDNDLEDEPAIVSYIDRLRGLTPQWAQSPDPNESGPVSLPKEP